MARITMDKTGDTQTLRARGNLSILDAPALRDCLLDALPSSTSLFFDLSEVDFTDLACIQVICSALNTYRRQDKHIQAAWKMSEDVLVTLEAFCLSCDFCGKEHVDPIPVPTGRTS